MILLWPSVLDGADDGDEVTTAMLLCSTYVWSQACVRLWDSLKVPVFVRPQQSSALLQVSVSGVSEAISCLPQCYRFQRGLGARWCLARVQALRVPWEAPWCSKALSASRRASCPLLKLAFSCKVWAKELEVCGAVDMRKQVSGCDLYA
jgi:hypothetical protein